MTMVPGWLNDVVRDFAAGMGIRDLALNADGVVSLRFESGIVFRLEYAVGFLALSMSVEALMDIASTKLLLTASDPLRRGTCLVRAGTIGKPPRAMFTVRLDSSEVTLGNLDAAMSELWRTTENFRRRVSA